MKLVAILNAYNEEQFVGRCLAGIYDYIDVVVVSDNCYAKPGKSIDNTGTIIDQFPDPQSKIIKLDLTNFKYSNNTSVNEAAIKTKMLDISGAEEGDWILILDADEFYMKEQLNNLKEFLKTVDKPFIRVKAKCFFYNLKIYADEDHGRLFKYKKGSFFKGGHNKFNWPDRLIYAKKYEFEMPKEVLLQYHLKFLKPLDRLQTRYILYSDPMANRKLRWLKHVFFVWPLNPEKAYANCKKMFNSDSFDTGRGGKLREYNGTLPEVLNGIDIDLLDEIKERY